MIQNVLNIIGCGVLAAAIAGGCRMIRRLILRWLRKSEKSQWKK